MPSQDYKAELDRAWDLHVRKNAGYAGADNPDPWANFRMCEAFGITAFQGCMVRMSDKYIRVTNLMRDAANDQVGESIIDTLRDLAAYALIGVVLLNEQATEANISTAKQALALAYQGNYQQAFDLLGVQLPDLSHSEAEARHERLENGEPPEPAPMDDTTPWCGLQIAGGLRCERKQGHRGTCYHS